MRGIWTGPLACPSLSSVVNWIRSDPSIWKPVFPNLVLPNKVEIAFNVFWIEDLYEGTGDINYVSQFWLKINPSPSVMLKRLKICIKWKCKNVPPPSPLH